MNSEITNVSKLVPATVVKSNRQNEDSASVKADAGIVKNVDSDPELASLVDSAKEKEPDSKATSLDKLKSAAVAGNSILQAANRNLEFKIDESTKKVVVKIVDSQSGETIRQIPSEDMLEFIKKMQELDGKNGSVIQGRA